MEKHKLESEEDRRALYEEAKAALKLVAGKGLVRAEDDQRLWRVYQTVTNAEPKYQRCSTCTSKRVKGVKNWVAIYEAEQAKKTAQAPAAEASQTPPAAETPPADPPAEEIPAETATPASLPAEEQRADPPADPPAEDLGAEELGKTAFHLGEKKNPLDGEERKKWAKGWAEAERQTFEEGQQAFGKTDVSPYEVPAVAAVWKRGWEAAKKAATTTATSKEATPPKAKKPPKKAAEKPGEEPK